MTLPLICSNFKPADPFRVCQAKTPDGVPRCGRTLPLDVQHFELINNGTGYRQQCKECINARRREKAAVNAGLPRPPKPACEGCGNIHNNYRGDLQAYRRLCHACDGKGKKVQKSAKNKRYRKKYPDKVKKRNANVKILRATNTKYKLTDLKGCAKKRNILVRASDEAIMALMVRPCFGCGFSPAAGEELNGVDRIDSSKPYEDGNLASACKWCNAIKGDLDLKVFLHKIHRIAIKHGLQPLNKDRREYARNFAHPHSATGNKKDKIAHLSHKEAAELWCRPCHWCGFGPSAGIDRIDNDKPYTAENSQPCCYECNVMRKDLACDDFLHLVSLVEFGCPGREPVDPGALPFPQVRKTNRQLVKVILSYDESDFVVFPSDQLHCGKRGDGGFSISFRGATASAAEYWTQETSEEKAAVALSKAWKFSTNHGL